MDEKILNRWIANSFPWSHKLPDPPPGTSLTANKRPFDGFAVTPQGPVYWEAKLMKQLQAFSFARIEPHQIYNLCMGKNILKNSGHEGYFVVILGVWNKGKGIKAWLFDIHLISQLVESGKKSFTKKDLEALDEFSHQSKNERFEFNFDKVVSAWPVPLNSSTLETISMLNS